MASTRRYPYPYPYPYPSLPLPLTLTPIPNPTLALPPLPQPQPYPQPSQAIRATRDYGYHSHYTRERQLWQDGAVESVVSRTEPQPRPWIVYTCVLTPTLPRLLSFTITLAPNSGPRPRALSPSLQPEQVWSDGGG